jgi:PilZ domain
MTDSVTHPVQGDTRAKGSRRHAGPGQPAVGTAVTLVPVGDVRLLTGTLLWWSEQAESASAPVEAGVDIAPTSLRGQTLKVWATLHATGGDTVVLSADARRGDSEHTLLLSGRVAVREQRRRSVRAAAHLDVELNIEGVGGGRHTGRTLDLSAAGCRIALEPGTGDSTTPDPGQSAEVVIHLDRDNQARVSGHIHIVRAGGQVVVRFDAVPNMAVEQIERYVYATLP